MVTINEFLSDVLSDFEDYLATKPRLCDLKSLNFNGGQIPNYNDIHIQQYYLLRYVYAYAFEYKIMYLKLLRNFTVDDIWVTSIGCGNMIDYWSLIRALHKMDMQLCKIKYVGIDQIDWNYKFEKRKMDEIGFYNDNIVNAMEQADSLNADVYFFPKSISEFSDDEMERICFCFSKKPIIHDKIHILISLRANEYSMERDMQKSQQLIEAITSNGFNTNDEATMYTQFEENQKIREIDSDFQHPSEVIDLLKILNSKCGTVLSTGSHCEDQDCSCLDRWPIIKTGMIKYQILNFQRNT